MVIRYRLVRDKSPAVQRESAIVLDDKNYVRGLIHNLKEAVVAFESRRSLEQLAEIKELIIAIRVAMGAHAGELEDARRKIADQHGRYNKQWAVSTEDSAGS